MQNRILSVYVPLKSQYTAMGKRKSASGFYKYQTKSWVFRQMRLNSSLVKVLTFTEIVDNTQDSQSFEAPPINNNGRSFPHPLRQNSVLN